MDTKARLLHLTKIILFSISMIIIVLGIGTIDIVASDGEGFKYYEDIELDVVETQSQQDEKEEQEKQTEIITVEKEETKVEPVQTDIRLDTSIFKTVYSRNENVDVSGLIVKAVFNDGTEKEVDAANYTLSAIDTSTCGIKVINVTSGNFSKTVEIEVIFNVNDVEDYKMYSSTSLNLREGPGTEFEVLGSINLNDEVLVIAEADNGWVKVLFNNSEYYCSKSYLMNEPKVIVEQVVHQNTTSYDENLLVFDGNVSKECKDKAISLFNKIPQNMKDAIKADNSNWVISSDSSWTDGNCGTYYPKQWYPNEANNICVYAKSVWAVDIAVIHEAGHWMDDYLGRKEGWGTTQYYGYNGVSSDENWVNIYNEEVEASGFPSWVNYCPEEYFAESTWKALVSPSWCKKTIPKTYDYIMSCVNRVE